MSYILIGLGNPGEEYQETRHNTGRIILDAFLKKAVKDYGFSELAGDKKTLSLKSAGKIGKEAVLCLEPETMMNNSGKSVKDLVTSPKKAENLVVIYDDLDLPIGTFKISFNRGSGGHRGVESIIKHIKTKAFVRFRIGTCPETPGGKLKKPQGEDKVIDFILGKFKPAELDELKKVAKKTTDALVCLVEEGRDIAMNRFN